jgi:hypothetical protein
VGARLTFATFVLVVAALGVGALAARGGQSTLRAANLEPAAIGSVRFGLTKARAVAELTSLFGNPVARGRNTGCGPRYTEVVWGDLAAEFRLNRFSGYRYMKGGYPITTPGSPHVPSPPKTPSPALATVKRVSLGSTLAQVRAAYGPLQRIGANTWRASNRLVFVDDARRDPMQPTNRIVEIKVGTCGDF